MKHLLFLLLFMMSCVPETVIRIDNQEKILDSHNFMYSISDNPIDPDNVFLCRRNEYIINLKYLKNNVPQNDASISWTSLDSSKVQLVTNSQNNLSIIVKGLNSGFVSIVANIIVNNISIAKDTLSIKIINNDQPNCLIVKKIEIVKKSLLVPRIDGIPLASFRVGDTADLLINYLENEVINRNAVITWDTSTNSGVFNLKTLQGPQNILTAIQAGDGEIIIRIAIPNEPIIQQTIKINVKSITTHALTFQNNSQNLNKNDVSFCLRNSLAPTLSYTLHNVQKDNDILIQWNALGGNLNTVLSIDPNLDTSHTVILFPLSVGTTQVFVKISSLDSTLLIQDTLQVSVKDNDAVGCLIEKSFIIKKNGLPIPVDSIGNKVATSVVGQSTNIVIYYTENQIINTNTRITWDDSLSNDVFLLEGITDTSVSINSIKEGFGKLIFKTRLVGEILLKDTIHVLVSQKPILMGNFTCCSGYPTTGSFTIEDDSLKFSSNFSFGGAPGPTIYLSNSTGKTPTSINVGSIPVAGISGPQTYLIPSGTNLDNYTYVIIWCEPFSITLSWGKIIR